MSNENIRKFFAIADDWKFFNFLKEEHYQAQISESFGIDKKYIREKIIKYKDLGLIKKVRESGPATIYKDTDETLDMIKYLLKYEFKEVSETEIPTEKEIENMFKRFQSNDNSIYNDAAKDFEALSKEKILKLEPLHIEMLKKALSNSNPKTQEGKEYLLFGLLNVIETLNNKVELDILNNYYENFKDILGKICIDGISEAEEDQIISRRCQGISIYILVLLNKESGINKIFEMIENLTDDKYLQSDFLQGTIKSEIKKIVTNSKDFKILIRNKLEKLQANPDPVIQKRAEDLKNFIRRDLLY